MFPFFFISTLLDYFFFFADFQRFKQCVEINYRYVLQFLSQLAESVFKYFVLVLVSAEITNVEQMSVMG